jgi:adenine/guanine phosphoribosyltransferase-like PRPP-binding protein
VETIKRPVPSAAEIEEKLNTIRETFQNITCFELDGKVYAAFAINECVPPVQPEFVEDVADCLTYFADFTALGGVIVSAAIHAAGALVHACSCRTGQPYTLSNWYPDGLDGDVKVKETIGLTGNKGNVYLNSIEKGQKIVFVDDILWESCNAAEHAEPIRNAGAEITGVVFVGEAINLGGRAALEKALPGVPIFSLIKFTATLGKRTILDSFKPDTASSPKKEYEVIQRNLSYHQKVERTLASFVGVQIQQTTLGYPYCMFSLTDFSPMMVPDLVEHMAECCVMMANFDDADIIVSESDRGGGPLIQACATRAGLPFCLANWYNIYIDGSSSNTTFTTTDIGFAGSGTIYVHGLTPGSKVMVVDDMLSSGGTAEALIRCIQKAGCEVVGAVFAAEKVNLNGRKRLNDLFPNVKIFAVCKFIAEPADPLLYTGTISRTVAFQELALPFGAKLSASPAAPRGGKSDIPDAEAQSPTGNTEEGPPVRRRG